MNFLGLPHDGNGIDSLRKTAIGRRGARSLGRRRVAHPGRRHRFLPGARRQAAQRKRARHQRPSALRGIAETPTHLVIGARTSWTDIIRHPLPAAFDALKQAAREVGSIQIQNTGTVAGNLCNASPAADGVPALMILDAEVEIAARSRQAARSRWRPSSAAIGRPRSPPTKWSPRSACPRHRSPAHRPSSSSARGAISSSPSPWRRCGSRSATTTGSSMRQSRSAPARRSRSGCRRWSSAARAQSDRCAGRSRRCPRALRRADADRRCPRQRRLPARRGARDRGARAGGDSGCDRQPGEAG